MKNVHGDLNTNRDKNTESVEWKYNASNAILPFFPDKLRLLFFASHLVSFRISLDNEKDILRRLMNGKDSRSRLNLSEYIARASRCSEFQLLSFSLFFFLFIPFNLPHGREFKWAQIVNTWDNEEFSRLCVNGQLWSFIKICEIKKKKRNERSVAARHRNASPPKTIKYHIFLFPLRDGIFARSVTPFFHIEIQIAKTKKIHTRPVFLFFHFSSNVIHAWNVKQIYAQTLYIRIFSSCATARQANSSSYSSNKEELVME